MPALNYTSPFGERCFAQIQPDILHMVGGGVWNSAGAQYIRITEGSLHMQAEEPKVDGRIKHGTASALQRLTARKSGQWSLNAPIAPSGTAAVPPDIDIILQAIFGGAGTLVSGTLFGNAWEYDIYDRQNVPISLLGFQHGITATGNRFALGCVPTRMTIDLNGNILGMNLNGVSVSVAENESFQYLDTPAQGGLTIFPGEPGSFTANGGLVNAFGGSLYIGNQLFSNQCDAFSLEFQTGQGLKGNFVDSAYPACVVYNERSAAVTMGFVNNDSTQLAQLKAWARQNTPVDVAFYLGSTPGYRMYVICRGVQFLPSTLTDSQGYCTASFASSASSVQVGKSNDLAIGFA